MVNEFIKATGSLNIVLRDANNNIKHEVTVPNLVVTVGKSLIASRLVGTASTVMTHMSVGTSSTAAAAADTALGAEVAGSRVTLASSSATANVITYSATFPAGTGTGALVEAGLFNASTAGTMLCRTTFSVINKGASDVLTINWNVTIN